MKKLIYIVCVTGLLSGCHIYKSYERPEVDTAGLYRSPDSENDTLVSDTTNLGNMPWQELFRDPWLQELIVRGLANNADLQIALLRVQEAQAMLMSSRLAYAPALNLAPQGTISRFGDYPVSKTYQLPVVASWEVDLFGRLLNAKRGAKTDLLRSEAYEQAVRTQVIAGIANTYYSLLMLDKQLAISEETSRVWEQSVETMRAMKEAGMVNEAAIVQSEANSYMVKASLYDLRRQIRETENALSVFLGETPRHIERGRLDEQVLPEQLSTGIPLQLLSNRPDVKVAEMSLAGTYYNANQARAAFYPQITLNGTLGWTNNAGTAIINPGKLILSAIGSLTQPLFNRGANIARLKVAKAQQEEALISFQQTLLNAGSEVSDALFQYEMAGKKSLERQYQIASLEKSVEYTQQLLTLGTSTYLEVLTAQQSLLSAQLSEIADRFEQMQAVVNLYQALGGGRE